MQNIKHFSQDQTNEKNRIRSFLATFKTRLCKEKHTSIQFETCDSYHDFMDRRRNPYSKNNSIIYSGQLCYDTACSEDNCPKSHNHCELEYHPLNYLTKWCMDQENCCRKFCPMIHENQQSLQRQNFFRFDLSTFKTMKCQMTNKPHDVKICMYYHNPADQRRANVKDYQHVRCELKDKCKLGAQCSYSHNKIEQLYHPSRYKSKFCEYYPNNIQNCQYRQFCSFAHNVEEISIKLLHLKQRTVEFYINQFKTVWCPDVKDHERINCVYAHNIQDFRRDPNIYKYIAEKCPFWNTTEKIKSIEKAGCPDRMNCNKCHGWKEFEYHPDNYIKHKKTKTTNLANNYKSFLNTDITEKQHLIKKMECKGNFNEEKVTKYKSKLEPVVPIQQIVNKSMIGAPFFQNQGSYQNVTDNKSYSSSQKTRAKTNIGSDSESVEKKSNTQRKQSIDSFASKHGSEKNISRMQVCLIPNMYGAEEQLLFSHFQISPEIKKERSSSMNKIKENTEPFQLVYSKQLVELLKKTQILSKLNLNKISEIKLTTMQDHEINLLNFLSRSEKQLIKKLKLNNCHREIVTYSPEIEEFFTKNNKYYIIERMKNKKVLQAQFLELQSQQIDMLSFIAEDDKQLLPKIIKQFNNNKEFSIISTIINESTSQKT